MSEADPDAEALLRRRVEVLQEFVEAGSLRGKRATEELFGGTEGWAIVSRPDSSHGKAPPRAKPPRIRRRAYEHVGRPSSFDATKWASFLAWTRKGLSRSAAATAAGLDYGTVCRWLSQWANKRREFVAAGGLVKKERGCRERRADP